MKTRIKVGKNKFKYDFRRIIIGDSTIFELPEQFDKKYRGSGGGASNSAIKIHYFFELLSGSIIDIINNEGVKPDYAMGLPVLQQDDLIIEDLGFFKIERFKSISQSGAWFVSRIRFGVCLYSLINGKYELLDLLREEKKMRTGEIRAYNAFIGLNEKLPARLILEKVDPQIAAEKRRKLKYDKQNKRKSLSAKRLKFCNLNAYITNTTQDQLPKENIRELYSLRWQIEIMFKAWKSIFRIDDVRSMKLQRFECMHYGLLVLIILTHQFLIVFKKALQKMFNEEISELKFFSCMKETLPMFSQAINQKQKLRTHLLILWTMVQTTCCKDQKINKKSPYLILNYAA